MFPEADGKQRKKGAYDELPEDEPENAAGGFAISAALIAIGSVGAALFSTGLSSMKSPEDAGNIKKILACGVHFAAKHPSKKAAITGIQTMDQNNDPELRNCMEFSCSS